MSIYHKSITYLSSIVKSRSNALLGLKETTGAFDGV